MKTDLDVSIQRKFFESQGLKLSYLDSSEGKRGESDGSLEKNVILIGHANGFSAETYLYYIRRLKNSHRVIALDFAGHGHSQATLDFKDWNYFARQIRDLVLFEQLESIIGVGHSLGGASLFRSTALLPGRFRKIIGLDPVLLSFIRVLYFKLLGNPLAKGALVRRTHFKSAKLIRRAFRAFPIFADWDEETFEDFISGCFRQTPGGLELACPREVEARIFSVADFMSLRLYRGIKIPAHIIIPQKYRVCPPGSAKNITRNHPDSTLEIVPEFTHFFPFEAPELTFQKIQTLL